MNLPDRLNRFLLLTRCLIHALFHGAANQIPPSVSRIVLVPSGKLGDVVCNTPVLRAIRTYLPKAQIIVAGVTKLHQPLLADSGLVDEYLSLEGKGVLARIKNCQADVALVTGPSYVPAALMYLAGIPLVVAPTVVGGFSPAETRPYKILQRFIKTFPYYMGEYAPRERLRGLEPIGIFVNDAKKHLGFSDDADKKVKQFFIANHIDLGKDFVVGVSPSAGNKIKEWPAERFAQVAEYLCVKYNATVGIIGSKGDLNKAQEMISHLKKDARIINMTGVFNLDELKALISKLDLFISVDTGPIYIAEAFDIPTIDITGPIDEKEQPPRGRLHRNIVPPQRLRPELFVLNAKFCNGEEALRQVRSISVSLVKNEIDSLIVGIKRPR